ncbi:glutamine amidotransferase [Amycolatopsis antarctica]|uniref:Glutamine amidotransferase n=2 Tax=Amycolatopsis antarctica TaxID=1854586 RepID=A0A263CYD6_9PSEU|nr:glutamine amidotransferase [Amycolatopsis antarctica]
MDTLADWETGYLTAELNSGRCFAVPGTNLPVRTVGLTPDPVTTMGGIRIVPEVVIGDLPAAAVAVLILPGGETWLEPRHDPVLALAADLLAAGTPVAAICGATMALGNAGMLDERRHTSNDPGTLREMCQGYAGASRYADEPAVTDGDLVTSSGLAPVEFARETLARLGVFSPATLAAWYRLMTERSPEAFAALTDSLPRTDPVR